MVTNHDDGFGPIRRANRGDQASLNTFVCADPPKPFSSAASGWKKFHPRQYEFDAQQMVRSLRVPARHPTQTWVLDDNGIAGVVSWTDLDEPGYVHLDVVAVAADRRAARSNCGVALIRRVLAEIEAQAIEAGAIEMAVECEIHRENSCSLRLMQRFQMELVAEAVTGAQTWALRFGLAGIE